MELFIRILIIGAWVMFVYSLFLFAQAWNYRDYKGSLEEQLDAFNDGYVVDPDKIKARAWSLFIISGIIIVAYYTT